MTTPAGWYDDGSGSQRWWDGQQWTEHVVTAPQPAAETTAGPVTEPAAETVAEAVPTAPDTGAEAQSYAAPAPEPAPFAPPYMMAPATSAEPAYAPGPAGVTYPGYPGASGVPGDPWAAPAAAPAPTGVPVLGIIGLVTVVVGVICACIPVIAFAGWGLLAVGFVLSLVSLFLRGRKWPGITGMVVAAVGALLAVAVSVVVLATTSIDDGAGSPSDRPSTDDGSVAEGQDPSSIEGAEMVAFADLEVGDCLPLVDYSDEEGDIYELPVVPCDQPHTDEVFFIYDLEGEEFPGEGALESAAWDGCMAEFEAYIGTSYTDSVLDYYTYQPTKASWVRASDRTVHCILYSYEDVTGSLRDAKY
ncbi:DUF2510 domain-containing protein [Microbacterium sp. NPDC090218]